MNPLARERRSRDTRPQPACRHPATPCNAAQPPPPPAMKRLAASESHAESAETAKNEPHAESAEHLEGRTSSRPGKTPPGETNQWLGLFLRGRDATIKLFAWFVALWCGAGACFLLWCAFCIGTGRWRSDRPVLDAALFLLGAVLWPLFAWFCIRVVLPRIRRDQDRLLEYIREHGGPRHALNVFLFGEPATNAPAAPASHADSVDGAKEPAP